MKLFYCPYTDRELPRQATSLEHVVPLALGGANGFEVRVNRSANKQLGASLDGKIASELLFALRRTRYDARGHSGKRPVAKVRRASYGQEGRAAQVLLNHNEGMRVWDVRDREIKSGVGRVQIETSLNIDLPVRLTAKIALAAGYYTYESLFREHVEHGQLRDVMNLDPAGLDLSEGARAAGLGHLTLRADNYLLEPSSDDLLVIREWCCTVDGTTVVLMPGCDCFGVAVGILGQYLGMVNVPANTKPFPNRGDYRWGHVILIVAGHIRRQSWRSCLEEWLDLGPGGDTSPT